MLKFKKSGSGFLLNKINKFNNLRNGYAYDKNYEKITHIEFEMERQKEVMVKLKLDLANKNKELLELTLKNKNEKNKQQKKINFIEEILKIIKDKEETKKTQQKLKIETDIEENVLNTKMKELKEKEKDLISNNNFNSLNEENETYNKTNTKTFYTTNNNFTNKNHILPKIKSPKIKSKLFINTNTFMKKKKFKDLLYMNTLRNQIKTLNIKLEKKQEEISDYKTKYNDNDKDFNSLENDLISDYDKLKELKYKNAKMCADLEDFAENYFLQREENIKLKNKLKDFIESFNNYKENAEKNKTCLEKKIKYFEEKNLECLIYHSNIGKNSSRFLEDNRSKLTEAGNLIEKINEEIFQINNDIKSKEKNLNEYKNEIDILNNKKKEINENKEKNEENIKNMDIKKEESDKKNKEKENINKNLKKELKEKKIKYKNTIDKIKEINDTIKKRDEEIIQLKEEIEKLKASKNVFYY